MPSWECDVVVVGAGVVGLASTLALTEQHPQLKIAILEKESEVAAHQTGHNSGVIHSGIYYKPGSYKARLCVEGARLVTQFCDEHRIPYERCGKVIVATAEEELPRLQTLFERGTANGVPGLELIGPERLREIEPHSAGIKAIWSPATGIVDFAEVARTMARLLEERGVQLLTKAQVTGIVQETNGLRLQTPRGEIKARYMVNCAGLYCDVLARHTGIQPDLQIIPFRGEYVFLRPERRSLVNGLIYPVPDPRFPFLGVHFTRTIYGDVEAGPNAVLAFAREGYTMGRIHPGELLATLTYPGLWAMGRKYWRTGFYEFYRSLSRKALISSLQRLIPEVSLPDIASGGAGVRAQAVTRDGSLVDDFHIVESPRAIHVLNAPSPAATASLAIGRHIAKQAAALFPLTA